jgi:exodeoxyribonuclease V alpha subunit
MTIHRLLEYPMPGERDPKTGKMLSSSVPKRDRYNPIEFDIVLADEYAMVATDLHRNLVDALPRGGRLCAFGDINQLPPIESGKVDRPSPFAEMLKNFDGVVLGTIHRQGEGSGIVHNAHAILQGRMPKRLDDFTMRITDDPVTDLRIYLEECNGESFSTTVNQIIVPTNKGRVGTVELNNMVQRFYHPNASTDGISIPRHKWDESKQCRLVVGDKVLWTQNNYDLAIFNGESGLVTEFTDFDEIAIDFGDRVVTIPPEVATLDKYGRTKTYDPRKDISLAYVVTTHKAQGSEYQSVVYVMNRSSAFIQSRNNFYTAVSRARGNVHLITDKFSLAYSVQHKRMVM